MKRPDHHAAVDLALKYAGGLAPTEMSASEVQALALAYLHLRGDRDHPKLDVVYRVDAHHLETLQADLEEHEAKTKRLRTEAFEKMRRDAQERDEDFDADAAVLAVDKLEPIESSPWQLMIRIKEVFLDPDDTDEEVRRLNLTAAPESTYFCQSAKFYPDGRKAQQEGKHDDPGRED